MRKEKALRNYGFLKIPGKRAKIYRFRSGYNNLFHAEMNIPDKLSVYFSQAYIVHTFIDQKPAYHRQNPLITLVRFIFAVNADTRCILLIVFVDQLQECLLGLLIFFYRVTDRIGRYIADRV